MNSSQSLDHSIPVYNERGDQERSDFPYSCPSMSLGTPAKRRGARQAFPAQQAVPRPTLQAPLSPFARDAHLSSWILPGRGNSLLPTCCKIPDFPAASPAPKPSSPQLLEALSVPCPPRSAAAQVLRAVPPSPYLLPVVPAAWAEASRAAPAAPRAASSLLSERPSG